MTTTAAGQKTIAARCHAAGGLIEANLGTLREELGYKKLGRYVLEEVATNLETAGLGFFPLWVLSPEENAEPRQTQTVWIYQRDGGRRAQVIDAILRPDQSDVRATLNGLVEGSKHALTDKQKLEQIRALVD